MVETSQLVQDVVYQPDVIYKCFGTYKMYVYISINGVSGQIGLKIWLVAINVMPWALGDCNSAIDFLMNEW